MTDKNQVLDWLSEVVHPAREDRSLVELGMVDSIEVSEGKIEVTLAFPRRPDPLKTYLQGAAKAAIYRHAPGGTENEPLRQGNIFSDEPGVYLEGKYGIRCENLLLCREDEKNEYGQFLSFETLTMCPFDRRLIDKRYLDAKTVKLLNDYHKTVYENLSPYLNDTGKAFLKGLCEEI